MTHEGPWETYRRINSLRLNVSPVGRSPVDHTQEHGLVFFLLLLFLLCCFFFFFLN